MSAAGPGPRGAPVTPGVNGGFSVVIATTDRNKRAHKIIRPGGVDDYDAGYIFRFRPAALAGMDDLWGLLQKQQHERRQFLLPYARALVARGRRLKRDDPKTGDKATLEQVPSPLVVLDVDKEALPPGWSFRADPDKAAQWIADHLLPVPINATDVIIQASSRAGVGAHDGMARVRVFFIADRAMTDHELKAWANTSSLTCDTSIWTATQPIYVSNPVFDGLPDPLTTRLWRFRSGAAPVHLIAPIAAPGANTASLVPRKAVPAAFTGPPAAPKNFILDPPARFSLEDLQCMLIDLPNNKEDWVWWNKVGMAMWCATDEEAEALALWELWSGTISIAQRKDTCSGRWASYAASPPQNLGGGWLWSMVREHIGDPEWTPDGYGRLVAAGKAPALVLQADGSWQAPPLDQWPAHMRPSIPLPGVALSPGPAAPPGASPGAHGSAGGQGSLSLPGAAVRGLPPPRQWIYGRDLLLGHATMAIAPGGFGKTAWAMAVALALASGKPLLGDDVFNGPHTVLFMSQDDDRTEMERRALAAELHHRKKFGMGLVVLGMEDLGSVTFTKKMGRDAVVDYAGLGRLEALITLHRPRVVMLDALNGFCTAGGVNDNATMTELLAGLQKLAERLGIAFLILHHERKGARDDVDADASMGAASIINKARIALRLVRMTETEASKFGVLPWESWQYIAVSSAKVNLAPMGQRRWVRLVGVKLGNGTPAYPAGDTAQTVEQWTPAHAGLQFDMSTIRAVVARIAKGATDAAGNPVPFGNSSTTKGTRDFSKPVAEVLRPGWRGQMPGEKAERAMAAKAVSEATARGWIVERAESVPRPDGKGTRQGLVLRATWGATPWKDDPPPGPFVV